MLKIKKTLGILLAVCFVLSVTAAAVSAAPYGFKYDGKQRFDNHDGKKWFDNHDNKKHKHFIQGHWEYKKVEYYKDRFHEYFSYVYEKYWISSYWSWE